MRETEGFRSLVSNTIKGLKGTARRIFMADVADQVGGQRRAAEAFGWGRETRYDRGMSLAERIVSMLTKMF